MTSTLTLPNQLTKHAAKLEKALELAIPPEWPEDEARLFAEQPAGIAKPLIATYYEELERARIAYLFREKMEKRNATVLARASKAAGDLTFLGEVDFVISFNWTAWGGLTPNAKIALVDHELAHCGRNDNEDGTSSWITIPHDVEEFGTIVRRWGLWRPALITFGQIVGDQLELELKK